MLMEFVAAQQQKCGNEVEEQRLFATKSLGVSNVWCKRVLLTKLFGCLL